MVVGYKKEVVKLQCSKEIENILIVSINTDGLSRFSRVIEASWMIYNVKDCLVKASAGSFFKMDENLAQKHNGIKPEQTKGCPQEFASFFEYPIKNYKYDYVVADNVNFVKIFFDRDKIRAKKPWICTHNDVNFGFSSKNLIMLGHYLGVNSGELGKSCLGECFLIAKIFSRINNIDKVIKESIEPKKKYYADIDSIDADTAKSSGFTYDADLKKWVIEIKEKDINRFEIKLREVNRG